MTCNYLFLCLLAISICFLADTVAREAIVDGFIVNSYSYLYQVSVQIHGHGHVCGGGIIDDWLILTTAHCVLNRTTRHLRSNHISILAGTYNLNEIGAAAVTRRVEKVLFPKEFHPMAAFSHGNIAVLKLSGSLHVVHHWQLSKLQLTVNYNHDSRAIVAGFGWTELLDDGSGSNNDGHLRVSLYNILSNSDCEESYPHGIIQSHIHLCAKFLPAPNTTEMPHSRTAGGTCHGDEGSPLVTLDGTSVIGILSRNPSDCDNRREPAVYTRVAHYLRMILNVMEHGRDSDVMELHV